MMCLLYTLHFKSKIVIITAEEARIRAEKEENERREQEKREAAERLLRENEVIQDYSMAHFYLLTSR